MTGGIPAHIPTEQTRFKVASLICNGFTQADAAQYLDIDETTLRRHYREELDKAKKDKTMALGSLLYQRALEGDAKAQEFWLKCQGGWAYKQSEEDKKSVSDTLLEKLIEKL